MTACGNRFASANARAMACSATTGPCTSRALVTTMSLARSAGVMSWCTAAAVEWIQRSFLAALICSPRTTTRLRCRRRQSLPSRARNWEDVSLQAAEIRDAAARRTTPASATNRSGDKGRLRASRGQFRVSSFEFQAKRIGPGAEVGKTPANLKLDTRNSKLDFCFREDPQVMPGHLFRLGDAQNAQHGGRNVLQRAIGTEREAARIALEVGRCD